MRTKRSISAARLDRKSDPVYKENRVQKPYKARFIRKTETKNHTSDEARHPHNAATDATKHTSSSGAAAPTYQPERPPHRPETNQPGRHTRCPHRSPSRHPSTMPSGPPPRRKSQIDLRIARRRTSRADELAGHADLQVATQAPCKATAKPHETVVAKRFEAAASTPVHRPGPPPRLPPPRPQSHRACPPRTNRTTRAQKLQGGAFNKVATRLLPPPAPDEAEAFTRRD